MRVLIFFDLPMITLEEKKIYRDYRKFLMKSGFIMMQKSVYCKLCLNQTAANLVIESVRKNKPSKGLVQALVITEKQYGRIEYLCGEKSTNIIDSDMRLVRL